MGRIRRPEAASAIAPLTLPYCSMNYTSKAFKHGLRMITVSASITGEASENMLAFAGESINTAAAGALDAAAKRVLTDGITDAKAKAALLKDWKRETAFKDAGAVAACIGKLKAPDKLANLVITDAGEWTGASTSPAAKLQEQAMAFYKTMTAGGMTSEAALAMVKTVNPAFTLEAPTPAPVEQQAELPNNGNAE